MTDLQYLVGLHMPAPISWWPLAPGWYVVIAVLLSCALFYVYRRYQSYLANTYRREAVQKIETLTLKNATQCLTLIKTVWLTTRQQSTVKPLSDLVSEQDWQEQIDNSTALPIFQAQDWLLLQAMSYQPPTQIDCQATQFESLKQRCVQWIKEHAYVDHA